MVIGGRQRKVLDDQANKTGSLSKLQDCHPATKLVIIVTDLVVMTMKLYTHRPSETIITIVFLACNR